MLQKPDTTSRGIWKPQRSMAQVCSGGRFHTSTCPCVRWALSCWAALTIFLWCPSRFTPRLWTSLKERADQPWSLVQHFSLLSALSYSLKDNSDGFVSVSLNKPVVDQDFYWCIFHGHKWTLKRSIYSVRKKYNNDHEITFLTLKLHGSIVTTTA